MDGLVGLEEGQIRLEEGEKGEKGEVRENERGMSTKGE